jgi:hypothetical protein
MAPGARTIRPCLTGAVEHAIAEPKQWQPPDRDRLWLGHGHLDQGVTVRLHRKRTVVIFTNRLPTGEVKVCKVAGAGVRVGTRIHFTVNGHAITVPAGRAPGGYCVLAGRFPLGTRATVTEKIPAAERVSAITASPAKRLISADLTRPRRRPGLGRCTGRRTVSGPGRGAPGCF